MTNNISQISNKTDQTMQNDATSMNDQTRAMSITKQSLANVDRSSKAQISRDRLRPELASDNLIGKGGAA